MHNQTQDSLSIQSRSRGQVIPEPPPEGVQRGGDKTSRMDVSTMGTGFRQNEDQNDGDEAHTGGIVRGGNETEESPPVGILRG